MFRGYDFNNHSIDDDAENRSFPSSPSREQYCSVYAPKRRLGKRRTLDASSHPKKDGFKGLQEQTNGHKVNKEIPNLYSQGPSSLTHPVSAYLTPTHKRFNPLDSYKQQSRCSQDLFNGIKCKNGPFTPIRKEISQPLKEIKNFFNDKKISPDPSLGVTSLAQNGPSEKDSSEVQKVLNKSFEVSEGTNVVSTDPSGGSHSDVTLESSHSDLGNNSSFMTAHDIYNISSRNRVHQELLNAKTPRKGFSLFEMMSSPQTHPESEALKTIFSRTPGLSRLESYKTPYKAQSEHFANEMFNSPLLNNPKTPMVKSNSVAIKLEKEPLNTIDCKETDSSTILKTYSASENETFEVAKPSPSYVKKHIFEGLGWSTGLQPIIFPEQTQVKPNIKIEKTDFNHETSSVLLTPNNSTDSAHDINVSQEDFQMDVANNSNQLISHKDFSETASSTSNKDFLETASSTSHKDFSETAISIQTNEPSTFNVCEGQSTLLEPSISIVNETVQNSIECETLNRNSEKSLDLSFEKTNIGNKRIKNSFIESTTTSVERLNLDSTNRDSSNQMEITVQGKNDSGLYCDETDMVTVQTGDIELSKERDVTVVARQPEEIKKPEKASASQDQDVIHKNDHAFVAPQPVLYKRPIPAPETNIVYVNKKPYTVLSMLGRGGTSEVYQVLDVATSKLMAMKLVNLASVEESIATGYLNEIEVLSKLQGCPSVIRMFDNEYIPESKILYVVMEKGDTDFSRLMKDIMKTKKISMSMITYYWTEMLSCVKDIHEKGIIHSDLKPANFLLVSGRLKLIDFGIASSLQGDMTSVLKDVTAGTFNYMSPEAIRNSGETRGYKITYKSDIWSLGCILYNLLYGRTPFSHLTNTWAKLGAIADPQTNVSFPSESSAPLHLQYSVRWALRKDPKERPTASELLRFAEITPGPETQLGRQISSLLAEYISQMFPNCSVKVETEKNKDKKL